MKTHLIILLSAGALASSARAEEKPMTSAPPSRAGATNEPIVLVLTNQIMDQTARRVALARQVNEDWTADRLQVVQEVDFKQTIPIKFGSQGGVMNIHCTLKRGRKLPDFILVHFKRAGETERWQNYRRVIVNQSGQIETLADDHYDVSFQGGGVLEQMTFALTVDEFRAWSKQTTLGISVAGEEFTLTDYTLNKWRTLLSYFDLNEAQNPKAK